MVKLFASVAVILLFGYLQLANTLEERNTQISSFAQYVRKLPILPNVHCNKDKTCRKNKKIKKYIKNLKFSTA